MLIRLLLFLLALFSMLMAAAAVWRLSPKTGRGAPIDDQGRRYEILPSRARRARG